MEEQPVSAIDGIATPSREAASQARANAVSFARGESAVPVAHARKAV
jgi:hypothetical protein